MTKGPPAGVDADDLWAALTAVPRPHRMVDLPRYLPGTRETVGQIAMWPLTQEEQMESNAEADAFTKKLLSDPQKKDEANLGYHHTFSNETAVQTVYRAARNPKDLSRPFFQSPKLLRSTLTCDEVGILYHSYVTMQSEVGPIVAYMNEDEQEAWIRRLVEGGTTLPFERLSWDEQRSLVFSMASQLVASWTDTSSAGSPPDASLTDFQSVSLSPDEAPPLELGDDALTTDASELAPEET